MEYLDLPIRNKKPRDKGFNIIIDKGYPLQYFKDVILSYSDNIDFVKFGWGTGLINKDILASKIDILLESHIDYFFGGTLFEKFLYQGKINEYKKLLKKFKCYYVEISNGTLNIPNKTKAEYIKDFAKDFKVLSEVGLKDAEKSEKMHPKKWIECIKEDLAFGAYKVIIEARESGTSGICRSNGDLRIGLLEEILESDIDIEKIIFEAPNKKLQVYFINKIGSNCNLANIAFGDIVGVETLRLGLRSDTFFNKED